MTDTPATPDGVPFIDNPHAPDVFADDAIGFFVNNGVFRITFTSTRVNHVTSPGPTARVVIGRLAMPEEAAERLARSLLDMIERRRAALSGSPQSAPTIQ